MPKLLIHELCSKILFDNPYTDAHKFFDLGQYIFPGISHRMFPPHTPCAAVLYSIYKKDFHIILVYIQHIFQDHLIFICPIFVLIDFSVVQINKFLNKKREK